MKRLTIALMILSSISTYAGTVTNSKNNKELVLECSKMSEDKCIMFNIILKNYDNSTGEILAKVSNHSIPRSADQIVLREKIKDLEYFPLSKKAYEGDGIVPNFGLGVVGAGLGFVVLSSVEATLTPLGWGVAAAGLVIIASPVIADTVSLPVRAIIKKVKIRRANQFEEYAFKALHSLLTENENLEVNNARFNKMVKAFKEIVQI